MNERDVLAAELALLEVEVDVARLAAGNPDGGLRRALHAHEVAAGVDFLSIRARLDHAKTELAAVLTAAFAELLRAIARDCARETSSAAVLTRLAALALNALPEGVPAYLAGLHDEVARTLRTVGGAGGSDVVREMAAHGIVLAVPAGALVSFTVEGQAQRLTTGVWLAAVQAVRNAIYRVPGASALDAVRLVTEAVGVAAAASTAGLADLGSQAANAAQGAGRVEALRGLDVPVRAFASEILDLNTCGPCAAVDGTEYESLDEAMRDYPDGTYGDCLGGYRCRGQLVVVPAETDLGVYADAESA